MPPLLRTPALVLDDQRVVEDIHGLRAAMGYSLRTARRWTGGLRRSAQALAQTQTQAQAQAQTQAQAQAQAIQGSNSIEGYTVTDQDALAAVDGEEPLSADQQTWSEILGYRRVLTYVLRMATTTGFRLDAMTLQSMHFMLLEHDLAKAAGEYRTGPVYVHDDEAGRTVYEGPDQAVVGDLVDALVAELERDRDLDPLVRAAMAHLDLVMIHPFRDGNGRMARALQTLVLASDRVLEPTFSSIEEWLGSNTTDYYAVLASTGRGAWHPDNDAPVGEVQPARPPHPGADPAEPVRGGRPAVAAPRRAGRGARSAGSGLRRTVRRVPRPASAAPHLRQTA